MTEITAERKNRLALFARDAVDARSDYQIETDAVIARTARLRAERLERLAVIPLSTPLKKLKAAVAAPKSTPKVSTRLPKAGARATKAGRPVKAV
jgi:hypothetical protein